MKKSYLLFAFIMVTLLSCDEGGLLIETDISNRQVVITAPQDGAEIASNLILFNWEMMDDATEYEIQVATPNFSDAQQILLNKTDTVTNSELELQIGIYEWRVRAKNSEYETAYTTAGFRVTPIESFEDNIVILTSPENGLITNEAQNTLNWQPVEEALSYRIQVLQNNNIINEQTTDDTFFSIQFPEGATNWQVRAENDITNTSYSSRDIFIDTVIPNTPTITLPKNNADLIENPVSFQWNRTLIEGSQETDQIFIYRDADLTDLVSVNIATSPFEITLDNGTYFWFVKASDAAGNESSSSAIFSFTLNE